MLRMSHDVPLPSLSAEVEGQVELVHVLEHLMGVRAGKSRGDAHI